jgi:hypothetical protein
MLVTSYLKNVYRELPKKKKEKKKEVYCVTLYVLYINSLRMGRGVGYRLVIVDKNFCIFILVIREMLNSQHKFNKYPTSLRCHLKNKIKIKV